ncbi:MAG: aminocarboxymuconate-semialdehyde decarboxylase [Parvularcula sp.]|nr:aminocarboxymuconate-semialdehyde decarboxylase [Parvularcula sp.]
MILDVHSHYFPESWPDFEEKFGTPSWPWIQHRGDGEAMIMVGNQEFRRIYAPCWDVDIRLEEMDRHGVHSQVISATPILFMYDKPPDQALECARIFNDAARELCRRSGGRLHSLAQVPLQDPNVSCEEVTRIMKDGHLGVHIGNHIGEKELADEGLIEFLQHCANEGAAVFVHPWDMFGRERMSQYMLPWLVGMPAETQLSILWLILSGAFEKLPKSLRIGFAHGGGSFAFLAGRLDNAWENHPVVRDRCPERPSSYVDRFYVDSAVFSEKSLHLLVDVMGPDRVFLGTDYPFPLGEQKLGGLVRDATVLDSSVKEKITYDNAAAFLGWPVRRE